MKLFVTFILIAISGVSTVSAQCSPGEIVAEYCRLDYEGARTVSPRLVAWEEEGGWDTAEIVLNYNLIQSHIDGDTAVVTVKYEILGHLGGSTLYLPGEQPSKYLPVVEKEQFVHFQLVEKDSCWIIARPVIRPHISFEEAFALTTRLMDHYSTREVWRGKERYVEDLKKTHAFLVDYAKTRKVK